MNMRKSAAILFLLTGCLLMAAPPPVFAKDRGGKAKADGPGKGNRSRARVEFNKGGPPPWAPAYGYRGHGRGATASVTYTAPFQIDVGRCNRGTLGAVLGGAAGGALGSRVGGGTGRDAAIIGGTILGAIVGQSIGRWMDDVDTACVGQILEHGATRQRVEWVNPDNGAVYQVTPTETYQLPSDQYCREFQTEAQIGGRTERLFGTACRNPDGSWERVAP